MTEEEISHEEGKVKAIKSFVEEMSASMFRKEDETSFQRDAVNKIASDWSLDKSVLRKMASTYHKQNFHTVSEDNKAFEETYQQIFGDNE